MVRSSTAFQSMLALLVTTLAIFICSLAWTLPLTLLPALGDAIGLVVGTLLLSAALARFFLGMVSDRYGARHVLPSVMVAVGATLIGFTLARSFEQSLLVFALLGIAGGAYPVGAAYVSEFYKERGTGTALGILFGTTLLSGWLPLQIDAHLALHLSGVMRLAQIGGAALTAFAVIFWILAARHRPPTPRWSEPDTGRAAFSPRFCAPRWQ
ncbi:MAG: MFS transporter [Alphaproteobacteria bacterium]|nr:MFS transporter [Alphaproteobacteria bacterium]